MSASDTDRLEPNNAFDLLSNHRRRMLLYHLGRTGGQVGVKELAAEVAAMENGVPVEELTSQQRKRVYVSLYQTHLPKMAEMEIIDYDKEAGTVRLSDRSDIDRYLTTGTESTYPWTYHNTVLAGVAGVLLLLTLLDVPLFGLQLLGAIGMILVVFAVSVTIQAWHVRNREPELSPELARHD